MIFHTGKNKVMTKIKGRCRSSLFSRLSFGILKMKPFCYITDTVRNQLYLNEPCMVERSLLKCVLQPIFSFFWRGGEGGREAWGRGQLKSKHLMKQASLKLTKLAIAIIRSPHPQGHLEALTLCSHSIALCQRRYIK